MTIFAFVRWTIYGARKSYPVLRSPAAMPLIEMWMPRRMRQNDGPEGEAWAVAERPGRTAAGITQTTGGGAGIAAGVADARAGRRCHCGPRPAIHASCGTVRRHGCRIKSGMTIFAFVRWTIYGARKSYPVLRSPAAMPLIEMWMPRRMRSSVWPSRKRRISSTCR